MDRECGICFSTTTKKKLVTCPFCSKEACTECIKKYLETVFPWDCMHCHHPWNSEVVDLVLGNSFREKQERTHLELDLLRREKSLMEDTRRLLERNRVERLQKTNLLETLRKERKDLLRRLEKVVASIHDASRDLLFLEEAPHHVLSDKSRVDHPCPDESCLGFLTLQDYECTCCGNAYCKDCQSPINKHATRVVHSCDPDRLASIMVVMKESKPCPGCRVPIQKSEGCDQMWCTRCHTAFDWTSLKVLPSSKIHNPHLDSFESPVESMKPTTHVLSEHVLHIFFQQHPLLAETVMDAVMSTFREIENIRRNKLPPLRRSLFQEPLTANMALRVEFLEGRMTESEFVQLLVRHDHSIKRRWETFRSLQERVAFTDTVLQNLFSCHDTKDVQKTVLEPLLLHSTKK